MTLRNQIEQVLATHYVVVGGHHANLLDDLERVVRESQTPLPEGPPTALRLKREDLESIFRQHDHQYGSADMWRQVITEAIWRWATDQPQMRPVWCEHWQPYRDTEWERIGVTYTQYSHEDWRVCPVCQAHRPVEGTPRG